jgi:hypothetical protein
LGGIEWPHFGQGVLSAASTLGEVDPLLFGHTGFDGFGCFTFSEQEEP